MQAPLMVDVAGIELSAEDRSFLRHPMVGGVILFARNYSAPQQLTELCKEIKSLRSPPLKIAVDHEGGRVQRFHDGFTRIPPMANVGAIEDSQLAGRVAWAVGFVIAQELGQHGLDLSFAPVLDLSVGDNKAIGSRAFAATPEQVTQLALSVGAGLNAGGFPAVAKHFPGHGSIRADSHLELPLDGRSFEQIAAGDLIPFEQWSRHAAGGMMSAHIRFPQVCSEPVTFSRVWLRELLRQRYAFDGLMFGDDLGMQAARDIAPVEHCAQKALEAGCDVVMVCNDRQAAWICADHLAGVAQHCIDATNLARRSETFWAPVWTRQTMELERARSLIAATLDSS